MFLPFFYPCIFQFFKKLLKNVYINDNIKASLARYGLNQKTVLHDVRAALTNFGEGVNKFEQTRAGLLPALLFLYFRYPHIMRRCAFLFGFCCAFLSLSALYYG